MVVARDWEEEERGISQRVQGFSYAKEVLKIYCAV